MVIIEYRLVIISTKIFLNIDSLGMVNTQCFYWSVSGLQIGKVLVRIWQTPVGKSIGPVLAQ